jgi:hypothetical protein
MNRHAADADVLRTLASADTVVLDGGFADPLRQILRRCAEACEQVDTANERLEEALRRVLELERLLARVLDLLGTMPLPMEGGSWEGFALAREVRCAIEQANVTDRGRGCS